MSNNADRIEKTTVLRAPRERVWRAISDSREFGTWFGVELDGPFVAGCRVTGRIVPTRVDKEIAKLQEPHTGTPFECTVERVEPMRLLSFRWQPGIDLSGEPATLVTFELDDADGGTKLTITESGFDRISLERRAKAFAENEGGWTAQLMLIEKYLAASREH